MALAPLVEKVHEAPFQKAMEGGLAEPSSSSRGAVTQERAGTGAAAESGAGGPSQAVQRLEGLLNQSVQARSIARYQEMMNSGPAAESLQMMQARADQRVTGDAAPRSPSSGAAPVQRVEVSRIIDASKKTSFLSPAAQTSAELQKKKYLEIVKLVKEGDEALIKVIEQHAQGDSDAGSPFISVARNFVSLSYSTDDSENGVETILQNAPNIAHFDVPDDGVKGVWIFPAMSELSLGETELLVLLPPGVTLEEFLVPETEEAGPPITKNPYLGKNREQRHQFNQENGLTRTKFLLSEEGLKEVPYEDAVEEETDEKSELITKEDLTSKEIDFLIGRIAEELQTSVQTIKGWTPSERNQYLDPQIEGYLSFVNKNPGKRVT